MRLSPKGRWYCWNRSGLCLPTLSAAFVRTIRRPGRYGDGRGGHGLSLLVKPTKIEGRLSKTWSQRIAINGRRVTIGLGSFPAVTLAESRRRVLKNRRHVAEGRDPRTPNAPTFREATEKVIAFHRAKWTPRSKTEKQWRNLFAAHVLPKIGDKRVDKITTAEVLAILSPLWHTKVETAKKVKRYITALTKWAVAQGYRTDNPADDRIRDALGKQTPNTQHMRCLHHSQIAPALRVLDASSAWRSTVLAIRFLALTATRSGEVRLAQWGRGRPGCPGLGGSRVADKDRKAPSGAFERASPSSTCRSRRTDPWCRADLP